MNAQARRREHEDLDDDAEGDAIGESDEPRLPLMEYASLRAGLDLLPQRRSEIGAKFDLRSERMLTRELESWERCLAEDVKRARECRAMQQRMHSFWVRYARAGETTPAPAPSDAHPPSRIVPRAASLPVLDPALSLERYALLCFASRHLPDRIEALFDECGLFDAIQRRFADLDWQARLRAEETLHRRWWAHMQRLYVLHGIAVPR